MPAARRIAALRIRSEAGTVGDLRFHTTARRLPAPGWFYSDARQWTAAGLLRRHLHPGLPVKHHLVADGTFARQTRAEFFRQQFRNGDANIDGVANFNGRAEIQGLLNIDGAWSWQSRAENRGNEARRVKTMRDARAERCFRGKVLGQVDRVAVAGHFGKPDHIRRVDDLAQHLGHADRQIFEVEHP